MKRFGLSLIHLLWSCLIFSEDDSGCCLDTVWQRPRPRVSQLQAVSDRQSLVVSWLVNHSGSVGDFDEIQISRAGKHTIIYSKNVSAPSADSREHKWTWTSDLPLECVDHSVRVRRFHNQSGPSPWSEWATTKGFVAEDNTMMFPFQRVLREGADAMFCCVPPVGVNITSITYGNSSYPLISVGARVKAITVENLRIPAIIIKAQKLSCGDTTGKISSIWNYVSFPPEKPRNLSCATSDMISITCTWDPGRPRYPYDRNKQTCTLRIENSDQAPIICQPPSCTFSAVPQLRQYNISVVVQDQLGEETESYSFSISDRVFPVAEWDSVSTGVTDATVSWTVRGNLTQLNLLCQVTVDTDSTTQLNCSKVNGPYKVKLEPLRPNTRYSTRVRCAVAGRQWGKWTQPLSFITYPLVTLNLWRMIEHMSDAHSRRVTLLWTLDLPGSANPVTIRGFTVQWLQEGQSRSEWQDGGQNQVDISIGPAQCDFTVQAVLQGGSSVPAHIIIPKVDDNETLPELKWLSSSSFGFNLSWTEQDTCTCGYAVEWCILGNTVPCTLRWEKLRKGNNSLFLPAGSFRADCRYTFNIYGCTENGHTLLERKTGYSQTLEAIPFLSLVEPVHTTSSSVTLGWHCSEDEPSHLALITGYLITVKEVGSNLQPDLTAEDIYNVSVTDPWAKTVTIKGLKQSREYAFFVRALTKEGPGQPANITIRTQANHSAQLAKMSPFIFLLLGCIVFLCYERKTLSRRLDEIFAYPAGMNIKISELESFLQETGEMMKPHSIEECIRCDIEIVNQTLTQRDPETQSTPPCAGSQSSPPSSPSLSPSCLPVLDYCPQSAALLNEGPALQQMTCMTNKTYFHSAVEDSSEPQRMFSDMNAEGLQEADIWLHPFM